MASVTIPLDIQSLTTSENMELEIFCLVWLDANSVGKDARNTEQQLRSIINYFKKFQDIPSCESFIRTRTSNERVVMIVSGRLGREIVPHIHHLRQVISIYVYCMDKESNKKWSRDYRKTKAVVVQLDELVSRIQSDHKIQKKIEEPLSINIFTTGTSTTGLNSEFLFSQVLLDCLIRLKFTETDQRELIELCKQQYKDNRVELSNIHEFEEKYLSKNALWWYTRESFFYKTLNAALRGSSIHIIFLYRKYINDIQYQLKQNQVKNSIQVYRCQMMSNEELDTLKNYSHQFISINSFFSTSLNKEQALEFLQVPDDTEKLVGVLFQINADPKMAITKPFANLKKFSEFQDEDEILFMIGSIFRLDNITINKNDRVWIIQMTLCNDEEHDLRDVLTDMKEQYVSKETNFHILGKLLLDMSKFELALKYLMRMLEQLPPDNSSRIDIYLDLAKVESHLGNQDKSLEWRRKAAELKKQLGPSSQSNIDKSNKFIGSFGAVYTVNDLPNDVVNYVTNASAKLRDQFKQFQSAKIHPVLFRPSFDISQFDERGNKIFLKQVTYLVGPPQREREYIQSCGWTRYGLKVLGKYQNDQWLHPSRHPGNWFKAYHGTGRASAADFSKSHDDIVAEYAPVDAIASIYENGFRKARVHVYGEGVYCNPDPTFSEQNYVGAVSLATKKGQKKFKCMLQVAVNPARVVITPAENIWVVPEPEDIRIYGILIKEVDYE